jgi:hypothetical protein
METGGSKLDMSPHTTRVEYPCEEDAWRLLPNVAVTSSRSSSYLSAVQSSASASAQARNRHLRRRNAPTQSRNRHLHRGNALTHPRSRPRHRRNALTHPRNRLRHRRNDLAHSRNRLRHRRNALRSQETTSPTQSVTEQIAIIHSPTITCR